MSRVATPDSTVEMLVAWRGRQPGQIVYGLDFGVADTLIRRHVAKPYVAPAQVSDTPRRRGKHDQHVESNSR